MTDQDADGVDRVTSGDGIERKPCEVNLDCETGAEYEIQNVEGGFAACEEHVDDFSGEVRELREGERYVLTEIEK